MLVGFGGIDGVGMCLGWMMIDDDSDDDDVDD